MKVYTRSCRNSGKMHIDGLQQRITPTWLLSFRKFVENCTLTVSLYTHKEKIIKTCAICGERKITCLETVNVHFFRRVAYRIFFFYVLRYLPRAE